MKDNQPMSPNKPFEKKDIASIRDLSNVEGNIITAILRDHKPIKEMIGTLKDPKVNRDSKALLAEEFIYHVMRHAEAEEKTMYVHMKFHDELKVEAFEGDTEHAIAAQLIQEINATADDNEWLAKVKVLAESLEHHIEEEEKDGGMLSHVEKMDYSMLDAMGAEYERIKTEFEALNVVRKPRNVRFSKSATFLKQ